MLRPLAVPQEYLIGRWSCSVVVPRIARHQRFSPHPGFLGQPKRQELDKITFNFYQHKCLITRRQYREVSLLTLPSLPTDRGLNIVFVFEAIQNYIDMRPAYVYRCRISETLM